MAVVFNLPDITRNHGIFELTHYHTIRDYHTMTCECVNWCPRLDIKRKGKNCTTYFHADIKMEIQDRVHF